MKAPELEEPSEPASQAGRWRLARIVLALVATTFLVGFVASALWMRAAAPPRGVVTMPDLEGMPEEEVRTVLERFSLELEPLDSLPHPQVPAGMVLTQSPLPGQEVAPGAGVQVILSAGPARYPVPDVSGLPRARAEQVLEASGMHAEVIEVADMARAGIVVSTDAAAGTLLAVPARVLLRVSSGPPLVAVPDLVGAHERELSGLLAGAHLELGNVSRQFRLTLPEGEVMGQSELAGDSIPAGSEVDVVVATSRIEMDLPPDIFR